MLTSLLVLCVCSGVAVGAVLCSRARTVQGRAYVFLREDRAVTSLHGCSDGCVYRRQGDTQAEVCFKEWELQELCTEEPVSMGGCKGELSILF